jgi:hypothetical protein
LQQRRYYLVARAGQLSRFTDLLGRDRIEIVDRSGGKMLLTNMPCCNSR